MYQTNLFDEVEPTFKIDKPIRLIELFAGIGSQAKALKNLGVEFEHWRVVEWDKYAIASYNAVHGTNFTTTDICDVHAKDLGIIDTDKYCYIMTYSFPCVDLSLAGGMKGMAKGGGTRSGLLWEVERILDECDELPQVLLMENVTMIHNNKNFSDFISWHAKLLSLGYNSFWSDLNAKDYGVPQNRDRTFMVSILGDYYYQFPEKVPLEKKLSDLLEDNVDEKYYISKQFTLGLLNTPRHTANLKLSLMSRKGISRTLVATFPKHPLVVTVDENDEEESLEYVRNYQVVHG